MIKKLTSFCLVIIFVIIWAYGMVPEFRKYSIKISKVYAAWSSNGALGSAGSKTSSNSLTMTTTSITNAGQVVIVGISKDNVQTTDGDSTEVTSITDSAGGNTWTLLKEYTNGQGSANAGHTVSLWASKLTNGIANGGTITANFSSSIVAKAMSAREFSFAAGSTFSIEGVVATEAIDAGTPGSLDVSTSNGEYLWIRAEGSEDNSVSFTATTNFTIWTMEISGSGSATGASEIDMEHRIYTGTTNPSDPNNGQNRDRVGVYVALKENASVGVPTISTSAATGTGVSSGVLNGNITAIGGSDVTERGFAWGTSSTLASPGVATTSTSGTYGTGTFSTFVSSLLAGKTYYFRAFATNTTGTGYGTILNFTAGTDTTPTRNLLLFGGFNLKLFGGSRIILR
jgi:hypothetical protein